MERLGVAMFVAVFPKKIKERTNLPEELPWLMFIKYLGNSSGRLRIKL